MKEKFNLEELNLIPLNSSELEITNGGESLWYWIAYALGYAAAGTNNAVVQAGNATPPHKKRGDY
jgi:hypothetical protein